MKKFEIFNFRRIFKFELISTSNIAFFDLFIVFDGISQCLIKLFKSC